MAASPHSAFEASPRFRDYGRGFALPFRAVGWILASRRMAAWSALSGLVTLVALVGTVALAWNFAAPLVSSFQPRPDSWYGVALWSVAVGIAFGVMLVVGLSTVPVLLLAPLQDPLSEATELAWGGPAAEAPRGASALLSGMTVALWHTGARIALLLTGHGLLLLLNLIPVAGQAAWAVTSTFWTILWSAGEYLDAPMARHRYPFRAVQMLIRKRPAACLGFGTAVYLLMWLPLLNLFFVPLAVVGGTLLFRGLLEVGALPPPPSTKGGAPRAA